jgi:NAD(P) transhydrogenase
MKAAKSGKTVAVIDRYAQVGGGCVHWATIPSKSLRHVIQFASQAIHSPLINLVAGPRPMPSFPDLLRTAESVISQQVGIRQNFYDRNDVRVIQGRAKFVDAHTVEVEQNQRAHYLMNAKAFVIATGSRPVRPPTIDFNHPRVLDSDTLLDLAYTPHSVTVYGAGTIGCEYASMLRNLGVKINLVNTRDRLLSFLDDEITDALSYHLRDQGVLIRHNEEYESVIPGDDGVVLNLKSGKKIKSDILLWAKAARATRRTWGSRPSGSAWTRADRSR